MCFVSICLSIHPSTYLSVCLSTYLQLLDKPTCNFGATIGGIFSQIPSPKPSQKQHKSWRSLPRIN